MSYYLPAAGYDPKASEIGLGAQGIASDGSSVECHDNKTIKHE